MEVIKVKEVKKLLRMHRGTITVCSFDDARGTGGKRLVYENCMLTGFTEDGEKDVKQAKEDNSERRKSHPNFKGTATTNIRCANGDTATIHACLIETYNGKRVAI